MTLSRIKIVHVVLQLNTGGMEKLLVEFARHCDRSRFELLCICITSRGPVAEELERAGCRVVVMNEPPGLRPGMVFRMASLFRKNSADVVHLHNSKPLIYGAPAARVARVANVIYTRHGQRFGSRRGANILIRAAARFAHHLVCVSKDSAQRSAAESFSPNKICCIWNGIDCRRFQFTGPAPGGPFVMVGRLSPEKDIPTLLRAAQRVAQQAPEFRLVIAGDGPLLAELQELSNHLTLAKIVQFLGRVDDVPALLRTASGSVLSSLTEGISLSLLEAMSCGLPIVATLAGGNPEIVVDGETGLLVPTADPQRLADAMLKLWRDPEAGIQKGLAGRQRVELHFDVRQMVQAYESLYLGNAVPDVSLQSALPMG